MQLNDPLNQTEEFFSNDNDTIQAKSNFSSFGLDGDDVFTSSYNGEYQFVIGGEGNDHYIINSPGVMTIFDNGTSSNDIVEASGLGVYSLSTVFGTIDNRHLVAGDINSGQQLLIIDYQDNLNKIETIKLADGTYTYNEIINFMSISQNNLGNYSWEDADQLGLVSENTNIINQQINFYKSEINNISIPANSPTNFDVPTYTLINDDGDVNIEVGETLTINTSPTDSDGISSVSINWFSINNGTSTDQGMSDTYEIKASDEGNQIQFQVVVTDNLGNVESGILYELQVAETSTDDTNSSIIPITSIPETHIQMILKYRRYCPKLDTHISGGMK